MVTGSLTGKMGVEPILPVRRPVTKIQGKLDGNGDGVGMCKQAFIICIFWNVLNMDDKHRRKYK